MIKVALVAVVVGGAGTTGAVAYTIAGTTDHTVEICHATASDTNPYVRLEVDIASVDGDGGNDRGRGDHYLQHEDPIGPAESGAWGDIIPPIDGVHDGLNWTAEGQTIFDAGCGTPSAATEQQTLSSEPSTVVETTALQHHGDSTPATTELTASTSVPAASEPTVSTSSPATTEPISALTTEDTQHPGSEFDGIKSETRQY